MGEKLTTNDQPDSGNSAAESISANASKGTQDATVSASVSTAEHGAEGVDVSAPEATQASIPKTTRAKRGAHVATATADGASNVDASASATRLAGRSHKRRRVEALDGLRALCAVGIVLYHMGFGWSQGGLIGVTVFFVLSAYLVTSGLLTEFFHSRGTINLRRFWTKRLKRIMPTAIVYIVVIAAVMTFASHLLLTKMRPDIIPSLFMVLNWFKIFTNQSYFAAAGAPSPLTHFWYLAIDMQFYLIWPPILYFLLRRRTNKKAIRIGLLIATLISAILMAVLYVPGADPSRAYYGTDTRAMSLLLGCWLAFVRPLSRMSRVKLDGSPVKGYGKMTRPAIEVLGWVSVLAIIAMMIFTEGYSAFSYYGGTLLVSLIAVLAIAALVVPGTTISHVLSLRPLTWLGERAFAIYIWHYPIIELLQPRNATQLPWWIYPLELVLTVAIAALSYRFVEEPFRKHGLGAFKALNMPQRIPVMAVSGIVVLAAVIGIAVVPPVTVGGVDADEKRVMSATLKKPLVNGVYDVVFIGDSVSLGANAELNECFPHGLIDTKGERQFFEGIDVLQEYLDQGVVGDTVIFSLSTNGFAEPEELQKIMDMCGPNRTVWFVNIRTPDYRCEQNNAALQKVVDQYDNAKLIDWYGATIGHDDWLSEDGIHLEDEGRRQYADLIVNTMGYAAPSSTNTRYNVTYLGDVVSLSAADNLSRLFPLGIVDCAEGRNLYGVEEAYAGYVTKDVVGPEVVLSLGNEERLDRGMLEDLLSKVGKDKQVWLINNRVPEAWCSTNNSLLAELADTYENMHLIDWYNASAGHDGWFAEDGLHLTEDGAKEFARVIKRAMGDRTKANDEGE